ncbi:MAG: immunoglobulin domain-containing protein, partial [Sedimentisphaerales bacterium]|nr:immunoglobulin domain-containing protein [Sedimentisphaerales bacterium]
PDLSGNGNGLSAWDEGGGGGYLYRADVPTANIFDDYLANTLSVKNSGGGPTMFTDSSASNPTGVDIETITPLQWSIEASFKPEENGGHRTIVGRDSYGVVEDNPQVSVLYFKIEPSDAVSIAFADVSGYWHVAASEPDIIDGFVWSENPEGDNPYTPWYHMAATCDGEMLRLYLAEEGQEYTIVAQTDLTESGSPDTRLSAGAGGGGDWHAGGWSVGRGLWNSGHVDRAYGFIDEVRISTHPVDRHRAWNASPGPLATMVDPDVTFSWNTALDPEDPAPGVNPFVVKHLLYLQVSPTDPTWAAPIEIDVTGPTASYGPVALGRDVQGYRWRVDQLLDDDPVDPNTLVGPVWVFDTRPSIPAITTQPESTVVGDGDPAEFSLVAESESQLHYAWKRVNPEGEDPNVGDDSPTLTIAGATLADEGLYYCAVTNDSPTVVNSDQVGLAIRRRVAYWPLDGDYIDASGEGHDADPNGVPTFITGYDGTVNGAVDIEPSNGWATAGTWDPMLGDQMTVSFWLYWEGATGWQSFVAKRDGDWAPENVCWQVSTNVDSAELWFQSPTQIVGQADALEADAWQHITGTYAGGEAQLYLNGELVDEGTWVPGPARDAVITIGGNSGGLEPVREFTNGALDDVQIYNYALTDFEVARMYNTMTGESVCVESQRPSAAYDYNGDCVVDLQDFGMLTLGWLDCGLVPDCLP